MQCVGNEVPASNADHKVCRVWVHKFIIGLFPIGLCIINNLWV